MDNELFEQTSNQYQLNISQADISCELKHDIKDQQGRVFLKANCPITDKIRTKLSTLQKNGIIDTQGIEDEIVIIREDNIQEELINSITEISKSSKSFTKLQIKDTLDSIIKFIQTQDIPDKILDHLTVFSKSNPKKYHNSLTSLIFGTHIGKTNDYSDKQLTELMQVLLFENIGYARLCENMKNFQTVHPIVSHHIAELSGIDNQFVLESILEHEEKLDGTGFPNKSTQIHEYAQISKISSQYVKSTKTNLKTTSQLCQIYLLGNSIEFRTTDKNLPQYNPTLQNPILKIMQESLNSESKQIRYASIIHKELKNLANWCDKMKHNKEVAGIQKKIKSSMWMENTDDNPFQVKLHQIREDSEIREEFITDSIKILLNISNTATYLNKELSNPIRIEGINTQGNYFIELANPNNFS